MRTFVKDPAAATSAPAATATEAAAPTPPPQSAALARPINHGNYLDGDLDKNDVKTPYLSCVQAVGPKSQLFTPGTLLLGDSPIANAPAPQQPTGKLRLLFSRASKTFVENLPYNPTPGAPRPRIFNTQAEVTAVGGVTEWRGNTAPSFMPKLTCLALVRCPDALEDTQFSLIAGDKTYAPAFVSFQKTSYSAAKTLLTDLSLSLKGDPTGTFYDVFWAREQRGQNFVWVAKLVRARDEKPSEDLTSLARKLSGGSVSFDETDEATT